MSEECLRTELGQWARQCGGYEMRCGQGDAGRLVRLERVRRWLMAGDDGLPADAAGAAIVDKVETAPDLSEWLYLTNASGYARLVTAADHFLYLPFVSLDYELPRDPADCGQRGACKWMGTYWVRRDADFGIESVERLAVPVAKAQALWGWGGAAEDASPVQPRDALSVLAAARKAKKSHGKKAQEWTTDEHRWLEEAVRAQGGRKAAGAVAAVAVALDLTPKAVRNQLAAANKSVKPQAAAPNYVFNMVGVRRAARK